MHQLSALARGPPPPAAARPVGPRRACIYIVCFPSVRPQTARQRERVCVERRPHRYAREAARAVDAEGLRLGRMASECAKILLGKNKAEFTPGADVGDAIVIVNCEKIIVTGNKVEEKLYKRHSGRPGGMKIESFKELQARIPERIVEKAIVGMLPKNAHGRKLFSHLKVYKGPEHPHDAQQPVPLTFGGLTSMPDTQLLEFLDPDAPKCVN